MDLALLPPIVPMSMPIQMFMWMKPGSQSSSM